MVWSVNRPASSTRACRNAGLVFQDVGTHDQATVVRREVTLVILQDHRVQHRQLAVGGIPGHHADLSLFECLVQQAEVHGLRRSVEGKMIGLQ